MNQSLSYRPDIDGLRALALICVVLFHAFPGDFGGGFIGVDIFFVISGFLITNHIVDSLEAGRFSFINFFRRRISRIFPALAVVLIVCLMFGWLALLPEEYAQLGKHVMSSVAFISNYTFWHESGYFDNSSDTKVLLNLWSLGVEEQFYILWPLILFIAFKVSKRLIYIISVVLLASFFLNLWMVRVDLVEAFFSPLTRFWELLIGALISQMPSYKEGLIYAFYKKGSLRKYLRPKVIFWLGRISSSSFLAFIGLSLIVIGLVFIREGKLFPGLWAIFPTIGTAAIIFAGKDNWINKKILANRLLVFLGLISYPIYLFHWPLLVFGKILYGNLTFNIKIVLIAGAVAASWITLRYIESPIRRSKNIAITLSLIIIFFGIYFFGYKVFHTNGFGDIRFGSNYKTVLEDTRWDDDKKFSELCRNKYFPDQYCLVHDINKKIDTAIFGDSQANTFYWGLSDYLSKRGLNTINVGIGGCYPFYGIGGAAHPTLNFNCSDRIKSVYKFLVDHKEIKTVYFSFHHSAYFSSTGRFIDDLDQINSKSMEKNIEDALIRSIEFLKLNGKEVVLIYDAPSLLIDPRRCILNTLLDFQSVLCNKMALSRDFEKYNSMLEMVALKSPIKVLHTNRYFSEEFPISKSGDLMYRDVTHLSYKGSLFFSDKYEALSK